MIDCHFLLLLLVDDNTIFVGGAYIDLDASLETLGCESTRLVEIDENDGIAMHLSDLSVELVRPANLLVLLVRIVPLFHKRTFIWLNLFDST